MIVKTDPAPEAPREAQTRPRYATPKRFLWLSLAGAWAIIFMVVIGAVLGEAQAVAIAAIVVPSMAALIAGLLGIHRFAGSMDLRASADARDDAEREGAGGDA